MIYDAVMQLTRRIVQTGTATQEELYEFTEKTRGASFLFDDTIQAYCDELRGKAIDVATTHEALKNQSSVPHHADRAKSLGEWLKWFHREHENGIKPRFDRFLRIRE